MNSAFVGYEELGRSWRVLSTSADNRHNTLLDRPNSSFPTQPHSLIPNYIIHWLIFARFYSFPSRGTKSEGEYMRSSPAEHHGLNLPIPQNLVITRPYSGVYPSRCLPIQVSTHPGVYPSRSSIFWSYPLTTFEVIAGSSIYFLKIHMKYVVFMSLWPRTIKMLISNWPRTRKFSQSSFYATDWSKFDRWVHAEIYTASWNLFTLTAEANRVLCQLVMFNCLFPLNVQNEIQLLSRVFCYSWLVCLLNFLLRNVACQSQFPISDGIVSFFTLLVT